MLKSRIGDILDERGISTADFAEGAQISYNTALALRRGSTSQIDLSVVSRVLAYLHVSVDDLFEDVPIKKER